MNTGSFCLISNPSGNYITYSVADDGALVQTAGAGNLTPQVGLYLGNYLLTCNDDSSINPPIISGLSSPNGRTMSSPSGYRFVLQVYPIDNSLHLIPVPQTGITLYNILFSALRALGVVSEEEYGDVSAYKIDGAQEAMNLMLDELSDVIPFATTSDDLVLTPGQGSYTIGMGGADFNTTRPTKILDQCYVRDVSGGNNVDYDIDVIGEAEYNDIDILDTQSIPEAVWYDPQFPLGILNFYYVPDKAYLFHLVSEKPFAEITSLTTPINLPPVYKAFLKWNTAYALGPDYPGQTGTPNFAMVARMATRSLSIVQRINAANRVEQVRLDCPGVKRSLDNRGPFLAGQI